MEEVAGPDGKTYKLERCDNKSTYKHVVELRPGQFHAKITIEKCGGQVIIPGRACATAKEAALRLAMYKANPQPIVKKEHAPRGTAGDKKVRSSCLHPGRGAQLTCSACASQKKRGHTADEPYDVFQGTPIWATASPNCYTMFAAKKVPPPEIQLSASAMKELKRLKAWADQGVRDLPEHEDKPADEPPPLLSPSPPPVAVVALQPSQVHSAFDPAVLAKVAAIKAGGPAPPVAQAQ